MDLTKYKLIALDADGSIVTTKSGATFRKDAADWKWLPGRIEKIRDLLAQGKRVVVITNQGGVAYGFMKQEDILAELQRMCREVGIPAGGLYVCYTHPDAKLPQYRMKDYRRKPGPGMLQEAMDDYAANLNETLYVGDMEDDRKAAFAAGVDFIPARIFFDDPPAIVAPVTGFV
jgi:D-glycero-D-manno-heptose 1,7-bisphosphate phosphatase